MTPQIPAAALAAGPRGEEVSRHGSEEAEETLLTQEEAAGSVHHGPACLRCGQLFTDRHRYHARGLARTCYRRSERDGTIGTYPAEKPWTPSGIVVSDVAHLLTAGESPHQVARILARKPGTLARALERAGRRDLASPFNALAWAARQERAA